MEGFETFFFVAGAAGLVAELGGGLVDLVQFGFDVVVDAGVEGLVGEAVVVEPEGVAAGAGGEGPVDGGVAAALGVAAEVLGKEGVGLGEVVAQAGAFEDLAGFLLDVSGLVAPDEVEHLADVGDDVVGVAFVVYEDAVEGDGDGVVGREFGGAGRG